MGRKSFKIKKVKSDVVINNYIDPETGEVLDTDIDVKHEKIVVDNYNDFVIAYAERVALYAEMDFVETKLLIWCSSNAQYNTNIVNLTKPMCAEITKVFGITYNTIKNGIARLKKKNVLVSLGSGTYRVNPRYYWRGTQVDRRRVMRYVLEIECPQCND